MLMEKKELVNKIKENLTRLPLSFGYLGAIKEQEENSNYNGISYKPDTVAALQSNAEMVGYVPKPISRFIRPVAAFADPTQTAPTNQPPTTSTTTVIDPQKIFTLFACCIPVKGASRSLICDVQRQHFDFIPNALYQLLTDNRQDSLAHILEQYGADNAATILEYYTFLTDAEYGFWASPDELALFPPLSLDWKVPYTVTNSIIDWDENSHFDIKQVITQLDELGCAALQLRCYSQQPLSFFEDLLLFTKTSRIKAIDLVFPWFQGLTSMDLVTLAEQYLRINSIVVHSAPFIDYIDDVNNRLTRVVFTPEVVTSEHHCGLVFADYFTLNMSVFTEAHHFNSCLNRKISIDKQGQIKNCPSMPQSFGDVAITRLQEVLEQPAFTRQWHITKDDIAVCKDCEFRYVCTDCRAYTQGFNNPLGKPAACSYNPYTATWETQTRGEEAATWALTANEQNA
jgi:SPASM domain peptide maturase of grasp-with-spasm system